MNGTTENRQIQIAVVMRSVRSAIGYNQIQFAEFIGSSKPTIARIETLELPMNESLYVQMIERLKEIGVTVSVLSNKGVSVAFDENALTLLRTRLQDESLRRSDRKAKN